MAPSPARVAASAVLLAGLLAAPAGAAAERTLHWRALEVEARLDASGDLHVAERQAMVFTGAWNGGERVFRVEPWQRLRLERVSRLDAGGAARPLAEGSLDAVDRFAWADARTLRWRSRAPRDPPFRATEIGYLLEYTVANVLVDQGEGRYRLAHDFAFADRPGPILEVRVRLALDPSWRADSGPVLTLVRRHLSPGQGAVLVVPLRWAGAEAAPAVGRAAPRGESPGRERASPPPAPFPAWLRLPLLLAMAASLILASAWVRRLGAARGLFDPLPDPAAVDETFLREYLLSHPPEVVGAAWDDVVSAPEVAAVLARMEAEGKLESRLDRGFLGLGQVLHLRLRVPRDSLRGHERRLVDGLFFDGDAVDSRRLRRHYRASGFDPASRVSDGVRQRARALAPPGPRRSAWPWLAAVGLLAAAALLGWAALARGEEPLGVVFPALAGMGLFLVAGFGAHAVGTGVTGHAWRALVAAGPLVLWAAGLGWLAWGGAGGWTVAAQATLWGAALLAVAATARTWLSPEAIAVRKRFAAARRHFAEELRRPEPRLQDAWIPYLLAFGLGPDLDRWLRVHGAASAVAGGAGGGMDPGTWSGGGGRFAGGGASGTWAALGSLSAAIPTPSSSSGSGSSGGSSSGGGGGGGW